MDFAEAEQKFQELQARVRRGEALSEEQYQEELAKLMVQDDKGTFWSLEPGTGRWLYFNGTEWTPGTPPRPTPTPETPSTAMPTMEAGAGMAAATGAAMAAQPAAAEAETVPTYVRPAEAEAGAAGVGGIAPRPVRDTNVLLGPTADRAWLPFVIGGVVLLLCAAVLFFGVRGFLTPGAASTATATTVAVVQPTATEAPAAPTDTAVPTAPEATAVAPTATPNAVTVTTTDNVRVRSGPGTNFGVVTTLPKGTTATVIGRNADSTWIQIQLPGKTQTGWVNAQFVTVSGNLDSVPVVTPTPRPSGKPTATETPAG